ncbi:MAG TPA: FixH family protein [Polyangiaceae bacterium]|nr:FixH family protein [Polyangiaceae bacterium]
MLAFGCSSSSGSGDTGAKVSESGSGGSAANGGAPATDGGSAFPNKPLSAFTTPDESLNLELRTSPDQPIHVGPNNEGELTVTDASGAPVDGLSIGVATWMPVMLHKCSEVPVKVKPQGNGAYLLTPLVASMTGKCELQLSLTMPLPDGGKSAKISVTTPTFDVGQ